MQALLQPDANRASVCAQFGVSRPTAYKWLARYHQAGQHGLETYSSRPRDSPQRWLAQWRTALLRLRRRYPQWGAKKLLCLLRQEHSRGCKLPALRTLERWLQQAGLSLPPPRRARPGPAQSRPKLTIPASANDVWTLDFKGWFRTADGGRCEPLTVRDLASRFILCVQAVPALSDAQVRPILQRLFQKWGLPRVIRVDNGVPFAGLGPWNLTTLSVWWLRLGIRVEFTRPGHPQDNGAHEQMHRVLKADTANPPAANLRAQQRRFAVWQQEYNVLRPHEGLNLRPPAEFYQPSPRPWQPPAPSLYPPPWLTRKVRQKGGIKIHGRLRSIGRAFVGQTIALKPLDGQNYEVYLDQLLLGLLLEKDRGALRPAHYSTSKKLSPSASRTGSTTTTKAPQCQPPRGGEV